MFSLIRLVRNQNLSKVVSNSYMRSITTSNKKDDTTSVIGTTAQQAENSELPKKKRYFYDYGFGGKDEEDEHNQMHASFFMYVTMTLIGAGFFFMYAPTGSMRDWAQREAYLELRRREKLGLPLIDRNYVDPATIYLPSDEDLGDMEIIV